MGTILNSLVWYTTSTIIISNHTSEIDKQNITTREWILTKIKIKYQKKCINFVTTVHMTDCDWETKITRSIPKLEKNNHNLLYKKIVAKVVNLFARELEFYGRMWMIKESVSPKHQDGVRWFLFPTWCSCSHLLSSIFFLYHWEAPLVLYPCGPCVVIGQFLCLNFGTQKGFSQ